MDRAKSASGALSPFCPFGKVIFLPVPHFTGSKFPSHKRESSSLAAAWHFHLPLFKTLLQLEISLCRAVLHLNQEMLMAEQPRLLQEDKKTTHI